jgi:hypothetical protein
MYKTVAGVVSIDYHKDMLLIGTKGTELYQVKLNNLKPVG